MQIVGMEMDQIELRPASIHPVQHREMIDARVLASLVEPQGFFARRLEGCRGAGIATREQCHVMSEPDQFFGQIENDALGAAIELWRAAFVKWTDLCNFHGCWLHTPRHSGRGARPANGPGRRSSPVATASRRGRFAMKLKQPRWGGSCGAFSGRLANRVAAS